MDNPKATKYVQISIIQVLVVHINKHINCLKMIHQLRHDNDHKSIIIRLSKTIILWLKLQKILMACIHANKLQIYVCN